MKKLYITLLIFCLSLFLTGCWDRQEIEEIGFVMAVAFDKAEEEKNEAGEEEQGGEATEGEGKEKGAKKQEAKIKATYQIVVPANLTQGTGGGGWGCWKAVLQHLFDRTNKL